jgi:hypothetical protein
MARIGVRLVAGSKDKEDRERTRGFGKLGLSWEKARLCARRVWLGGLSA